MEKSIFLLRLLKKILQKKVHFKYLIVGGINFFVAYFTTIIIYNLMISKISIFIIGCLTSIFCISFSYVTYKLFVFKTSGNWISEYIKCYVIYGYVAILSIFLLWFFLEILNFNIWISQILVMFFTVPISYLGHVKLTFKKK